jgi:hypothetical protein
LDESTPIRGKLRRINIQEVTRKNETMANWKDKHNPNPFIRRMENTRSLKDDGKVQFSGMEILTLPAQLESIIQLNPLVTQEDKHTIVWNAIRNAGKTGPLSSDSLMEEIGRLERKYLSQTEHRFRLISTLSISSQKHKLPNVQIDGNRITFSPKRINHFIKHIQASQHIKWHIHGKNIPADYTWVMTTVSAKSIHRSLNLFRANLNYLINYGIRSSSFGGKPHPINKIRYGPIHTLHRPDGKLVDDVFWYEEECFELAKPYHADIAGRFGRMLNFLSDLRKQLTKSRIKNKLETAMLLYNAALDSYSFDTAFIKLWATLELLTGTGRDAYDITVKRTAFIYKDSEATKDHLNILRDCRNDIVHKGYMEGEKETLLYDLKLYVEHLIHFLLWQVQPLNNFGEIKQLLDSCPDKTGLTQSKNELRNRLRIINISEKLHK